MRESPAVPFIGGARGFPAAASGDDERREEGEGVAAAGARVSPPVAWEGGDQRSDYKLDVGLLQAERANLFGRRPDRRRARRRAWGALLHPPDLGGLAVEEGGRVEHRLPGTSAAAPHAAKGAVLQRFANLTLLHEAGHPQLLCQEIPLSAPARLIQLTRKRNPLGETMKHMWL